MLTTPIGVREVVMGEFLWVFIRAALMGLGVSVVLLVFGLIPHWWALGICPLIVGFLSIPCAAIGLIAASWVRNINQFQTVYSFLIAPIYFLSGVFFPLQPHSPIEIVVQFSPFYHGVRLIQTTVWGQFPVGEILWHVAALLIFSVVLGGIAFRRIERKLTL